jgi:hypothetical protein
MFGAFSELDPEVVTNLTTTWFKDCFKLERGLEGKAAPLAVTADMKQKVESFRKHLPLITALRNPGLQARHWDQLMVVTGQTLKPDANMTLSSLVQMDLQKHEREIENISDVASKEYAFERALDKLQAEWKGLEFEIVQYRESDTFYVRHTDEILAILDDQILKIHAMRGSPYIKPLLEKVLDWEHKLDHISNVLDAWLAVQRTWLYLEPIFSSADITRQLPTEARRFAAVDVLWRKVMASAAKRPGVLDVTSIEKIREGFEESIKWLDMVLKGLNEYLETKRAAFPRFFFLSNDELLDILSETKDPMRVEPHLAKCFEGVAALTFNSEVEIVQMKSAEGEVVRLRKRICPNEPGNVGLVERWLQPTLRCVATCCAVLRHVALCCDMLRRVATCCDAWQVAPAVRGVDARVAHGRVCRVNCRLPRHFAHTVAAEVAGADRAGSGHDGVDNGCRGGAHQRRARWPRKVRAAAEPRARRRHRARAQMHIEAASSHALGARDARCACTRRGDEDVGRQGSVGERVRVGCAAAVLLGNCARR